MSDARGEDADIPRYPGQDRPGAPGAEDGAVVADGQLAPGGEPSSPGDDVALPSEMQGHGERDAETDR